MEKIYLILWCIGHNKCYATFERFRSVSIFIDDNRIDDFVIYHSEPTQIVELIDTFEKVGFTNFMLS